VPAGPHRAPSAHAARRRRRSSPARRPPARGRAGRLVPGRRAAHGHGNVGIAERQAVIRARGGRQAGKTVPVERGHQEIARSARPVAREDAAGPVGAVRRRGEPDQEESSARVSESRDGPSPVGLVPEGAPLLACHLTAVAAQPGTTLTRDNRFAHARQWQPGSTMAVRFRAVWHGR
jgi:hypothetical protein